MAKEELQDKNQIERSLPPSDTKDKYASKMSVNLLFRELRGSTNKAIWGIPFRV